MDEEEKVEEEETEETEEEGEKKKKDEEENRVGRLLVNNDRLLERCIDNLFRFLFLLACGNLYDVTNFFP